MQQLVQELFGTKASTQLTWQQFNIEEGEANRRLYETRISINPVPHFKSIKTHP